MLNGKKENLRGRSNFDIMHCDSMSLVHSSLVFF